MAKKRLNRKVIKISSLPVLYTMVLTFRSANHPLLPFATGVVGAQHF